MKEDYKRFTLNRQIFPRDQPFSSTGLICGHLNRLKYPTNVKTYLKNRENKLSMVSSLARANRCFCRHEQILKNSTREKWNIIQMQFEENKQLVRQLENIEIVLPKDKKEY